MGLIEELMKSGALEFSENMYGASISHISNMLGTFDFSCKCRAESLYEFLFGDIWGNKRRLNLKGDLTLDDITGEHAETRTVEIDGTLDLFDGMRLRYEFGYIDPFTNVDMHYKGQKDISLLRPIESMTTLVGNIYEPVNGELRTPVAMTVSEFRLEELYEFLKSWKLR